MKYDVIAIGMGPSSIFLAYELIQKNKAKNILLIEEGHAVEKEDVLLKKQENVCIANHFAI